MAELNDKQRRFIDEYLIDLNATEAAKRAGYSDKAAHVTGCRLLKDANVSAEIERRKAKLQAKSDITAERVVAELAKIGFANMADFMEVGPEGQPVTNFAGLTRDQAAALGEITVEEFQDGRTTEAGKAPRKVRRIKFKLHDKVKALVDIGRHLGMFEDKVKVSPGEGLLELLARIDGKSRGVPPRDE